jgi:hypothetical protein
MRVEPKEGGFIIALTVFIILGMIMPPLVIHDHLEKKTWKEGLCKGAEELYVYSGDVITYSYGSVVANVLGKGGNVTHKTQIVYPPNRYWLLVGKKQHDVKRWAAALGAVGSYTCYLSSNEMTGISLHFNGIAGWWAWMAITILSWFVLIGYVLCLCGISITNWVRNKLGAMG